MADEQKWVPDPPFGLHGPTADAPGSILDPATRKAIREVLTPALVATAKYLLSQLLAGNITKPPEGLPIPQLPFPPMQGMPGMPGMPGAAAPGGAAPEQPVVSAIKTVAQGAQRAGSAGNFPHGDVDLSFITPNVVAPNAPRSGQGRQFYFLKKPNVPGGG